MTNTVRDMGIPLPDRYADWEYSAKHTLKPGRFIRVTFAVVDGVDLAGDDLVPCAYFFEPSPKLPPAQRGAVLRFTHKGYGTIVQAVKWGGNGAVWHIQFRGVAGVLCETYCGDAWLLENVDADGFTVELEGL